MWDFFTFPLNEMSTFPFGMPHEKVTEWSLYNITHENLKLRKKIFKRVKQNSMLERVAMLYKKLNSFGESAEKKHKNGLMSKIVF